MRARSREIAEGLAAACSMFSVLPAPSAALKGARLKYAMCFFPLIGAVIGGAGLGWLALCRRFGAVPQLFAAVMCAVPVVISGGIHMDGFIDACDAFFSRGDERRRREILRDPHAGAFGVTACALYFILQFGLWSQIYALPGSCRFGLAVFSAFVISRALGGLFIAQFKTADGSGLARAFGDSADKGAVIWTMAAVCILTAAGLALVSVYLAAFMAIACMALLCGFAGFCARAFGGITGDLAGCLVQLAELMVIGVCAAGGIICSH